MPFPAVFVYLSEGWFFLEESTMAHLWGVVYPLLGPGIVHYV